MRNEVSRREALSLANFGCYTQKRQETAWWINASHSGGCMNSMSDSEFLFMNAVRQHYKQHEKMPGG